MEVDEHHGRLVGDEPHHGPSTPYGGTSGLTPGGVGKAGAARWEIAQRERGPRLLVRTRLQRPRWWRKREVKVEFGSAPGEDRAGQTEFIFLLSGGLAGRGTGTPV